MPLFTWREEYSVGNAQLDQHHKEFISILNVLYGNCFNADKVCDVDKNIEELLTVVSYNFSAEENFMREIGYTGMDGHIEEHNIFKSKILELQETFRNNHLELTKELITYLGRWLLTHILKEDRQYAQQGEPEMPQ